MLTVLEILIILANIPVLIWALLPVKRVPRFLDFMPLAAVGLLIMHLFFDKEPVVVRMLPIYIFTIIMFLVTIVRIFRHNPNQPKRRILAGIGRVFGLFALGICVFIPTVVLPFHSLPEPTGNYDVGTVVTDFTDQNRKESYSANGESRKIAVQFWYPTDRTSDEVQYDLEAAPISKSEEKYPVLIFSHGAFGVRMSNASTCRELASHGYIVASIDHSYHSFYTAFSDGETIPVNTTFLNQAIQVTSDALPLDQTYEITHDWLKIRTADIGLVIDSLKTGELGEPATILNGRIDFDKIGLLGHSLGGAAAAQVGRERDDVKAAIVIDGTMIGDITGLNSDKTDIITNQSYTKPLMQMYGSLFLEPAAKETSYQPNINAFENATAPAYSLCIEDSGHLNFTDLPRISPFLSRMLGVGTVDSFECIKIVNDYSLAFFDQHIKGISSDLLDGKETIDKVIFEKKIP